MTKETAMKNFPVIPGFRIVRLLGQGGMADVYEAMQENLDRRVAIKVIIPELFRDATFTARFVKEAQTAAKLSHPNVLHIYDVGATPNCNYIVMECLQESLKNWLKKGPLALAAALGVMRQIGLALDYAHRKGIVHRDVKPDNIMFREDGTPVLTDFGIAKAVDSSTKLTRTGSSVGTPHYMSPEQIRGMNVDGRADFYSLGIVFYEMLTGKVPYEATDPLAVCMKHVHDPIPVLPAPHSCYQPLLEGLLAKNPEERMASSGDVQKWIDELPAAAMGPFPVEKLPAPTASGENKKSGVLQKTLAYDTCDQAVLAQKRNRHLLPRLAGLIAILLLILLLAWSNHRRHAGAGASIEPSPQAPQAGIRQPQAEDEAMKENRGLPASEPGPGQSVKPGRLDKETARPGIPAKNTPSGAKHQDRPLERPDEEKVQKARVDASGPAAAPPSPAMKRIGLFELQPLLAQQYGLQFQRVQVAAVPESVNAYGQVSVLLNVDAAGRVALLSLDDQLLTVEPPDQQSLVLRLLSQAISQTQLLQPKGRDGQAVILEKWRLSFKIITLNGKIILIKQ